MIDTPTTYPIPLRIRFKKKRRYSDANFVQIDEAIDTVGRHLFPGSWGMSEVWREAPFLYLFKTHRLKRIKFQSNRKLGRQSFGGGYFRDKCHSDKSEAQSCSDNLKNAYKRLRYAIEDGNIKCFKFTKTNGILPFEKKDFECFRQQQDVILYSGRLKGPKNSVHVIQVQQKSLEDWIRRGCPSGRLVEAPLCLYQQIAVLIASSTDLPCIMSRKTLTECIRQKFYSSGYRISKKQFDDIIWNKVSKDYKRPGRKGGHRNSEQVLAWKLFERQIQESAECYRKRSLRDDN